MNIREVSLSKFRKTLDYLDSMTFPADDLCKKEGRHWWLVFSDGVAEGFAGLEVLNQHTAFLCRAGVMPSHRKKGLHRHLIRVREKKARALGIEQLVTYTHPLNLKSANNLISCGYRLYKPVKPFGFENALYFRKELV